MSMQRLYVVLLLLVLCVGAGSDDPSTTPISAAPTTMGSTTQTVTPGTPPPPPTDVSDCQITPSTATTNPPQLPKLDQQFEARIEAKILQVNAYTISWRRQVYVHILT